MSITATDFAFVSSLVRRRSAIVLEPGKEYLVEARLLPVARKVGADGLAGLVSMLQRTPESNPLYGQVIDALTTNETSWFRDRHPFDAITEHVLPKVISDGRPDRTFRIWSAACSSGQEAYSLIMTLNDRLVMHPGWRLDMLATDLSAEILDQAKAGVYSQLEVNRGLPAPMLVRHFERRGAAWQIKESLRKSVTFRAMNLAQPFPSVPQMDVIMLRNVLIYFDIATKRQVLAQMRRVLRPGGLLFLGAAETTLNLDENYERVQLGRATAYRLATNRETKS
jgi:chemotaxis protein methyltransferase CheR